MVIETLQGAYAQGLPEGACMLGVCSGALTAPTSVGTQDSISTAHSEPLRFSVL